MVALFVQDSNQLVNGTQLRQQQDGTTYSLVLTDVAPQDAGVYTCVAQNAGGQVLCKAELLVYGGELTVIAPGEQWGPFMAAYTVHVLCFDCRGQVRC